MCNQGYCTGRGMCADCYDDSNLDESWYEEDDYEDDYHGLVYQSDCLACMGSGQLQCSYCVNNDVVGCTQCTNGCVSCEYCYPDHPVYSVLDNFKFETDEDLPF